jgi:hypothetical protein
MTEPAPASYKARPTVSYAVRPAHLTTLIRQVSARTHAMAVAVRVPGPWTGGDALTVEGRSWRVVQADSVLAVREALADRELEGTDARLVILTSLDERTLGSDVLARVSGQSVLTLKSWELLRDLFRARAVDPRVAHLGWLADVLLEHVPAAGYPPAPSGVLDLDTAWTHAVGVLLGLPTGLPDALTLMRWSTREGSSDRWAGLAPEVRQGLAARFADTAGLLGASLAAAITAEHGGRLVALGLVTDVLWPSSSPGEGTMRELLAAARVRLEPLVGGVPLAEPAAREWARLAERVLGELPVGEAAAQRVAAEVLLTDLRAEACIELSRVLPAAAARRASRFARAIEVWLSEDGAAAAVVDAHAKFVEHVDIALDSARAERATMALRLVRALDTRAEVTESGFAAVVRHHVRSGSWADAARTTLLGGDPSGDLSGAYSALLRQTRERRQEDVRRFAERLVAWNERPAVEPEVVPVERVLEQIVAPIADVRPVLVVLLDGLDFVVWRQLHADLTVRGWTWWQSELAAVAPVGIAALPSVTSISRASLFAGVVKPGNQSTEKSDFAQHPALRRTGARPPVLFHKGELGGSNGLASDVRDVVANGQQRVVGVVVNAVDDWLDRSDQVLPRWSVSAIPLLDALLQEAAVAGRVVVVLSDHGHLLDYDTTLRPSGDGARWRLPSGVPAAGEALATGPRIHAATGQDAVVLAYSESLRYSMKKTGYHGGASPQEVAAPIAVLSRDELGVSGWRPVADVAPSWWDATGMAGEAGQPLPKAREVSAVPTERGAARAPASQADVRTLAEPAAWIQALLASPVYEMQRSLAGRTAPRDEQMLLILQTLEHFHDRAPRSALAARLALPEFRVRGVLTAARRVLNVEGFAVLEEEETSGTLILNGQLLRVQFGLSD